MDCASVLAVVVGIKGSTPDSLTNFDKIALEFQRLLSYVIPVLYNFFVLIAQFNLIPNEFIGISAQSDHELDQLRQKLCGALLALSETTLRLSPDGHVFITGIVSKSKTNTP
ncbi:hypothetical protein QAD02_024406 [Eretmocerus hayati]|uniref:Uncharacterized protein n=1 Tax=Eretmocerus hayati TaxID=131215 RepID=A0ACC2PYI5_9HYME|nr:hypothetical protein QAD02_024406 [Eretmocerus hayati]